MGFFNSGLFWFIEGILACFGLPSLGLLWPLSEPASVRMNPSLPCEGAFYLELLLSSSE